MRLWIQTAELGFLCRVAGLSLKDKERSPVIQEGLRVELLFLHVESHLRWSGHVVRMPPGHLLGEVFRACLTGRRPQIRPRTCWRDTPWLAWEHLGVIPEEQEEVAAEKKCWPSLLKLIPPQHKSG